MDKWRLCKCSSALRRPTTTGPCAPACQKASTAAWARNQLGEFQIRHHITRSSKPKQSLHKNAFHFPHTLRQFLLTMPYINQEEFEEMRQRFEQFDQKREEVIKGS